MGETFLPIREYGWNCPRRLSGSRPINAARRCEFLDRPRGQCDLDVGPGGTFAIQPFTERQRELAHKRPGTGERYQIDLFVGELELVCLLAAEEVDLRNPPVERPHQVFDHHQRARRGAVEARIVCGEKGLHAAARHDVHRSRDQRVAAMDAEHPHCLLLHKLMHQRPQDSGVVAQQLVTLAGVGQPGLLELDHALDDRVDAFAGFEHLDCDRPGLADDAQAARMIVSSLLAEAAEPGMPVRLVAFDLEAACQPAAGLEPHAFLFAAKHLRHDGVGPHVAEIGDVETA